MILETPNKVVEYRAINSHGEWEDGTFLTTVADPSDFLKVLGYRKITIIGVRVI